MRRQLQCDQIATPPPVRWTLLFLALLGSHVWALRSNSGVTDPWGENQRPKLYTDYLTQHSGKKLFLKYVSYICVPASIWTGLLNKLQFFTK